MTDDRAEPFSAAEAAIAVRLHRWSDHGVVPIDAVEIATHASAAARGGRGRAGATSAIGWRRAILGMLALLLLAAAALVVAAVALQDPVPEDGYRAVVVRHAGDGEDVVLARADGHERLLRHVTPEDLGIDTRYGLQVYSAGQAVSQQGWLELFAYSDGDDRSGLEPYGLTILVDLADAERAPITVLANGFMGGRWGPDGTWAYYCAVRFLPGIGQRDEPLVESAGLPDCGMEKGAYARLTGGPVRVLRPDLGLASEVIVSSVQTFGGGPEIVWAADGSGFLAQRGTEWGVTPLDGGPFRPGTPEVISREIDPSRPDLEAALDWEKPSGDSGLAPATPVAAQLAADGTAIWQLLDDRTGPSPRALLARLTAPGMVETVHSFDLPAGTTWSTPEWPASFTLSPDDTLVAIHLNGGPGDHGFVLTPLGAGDTTVTTGPVMDGSLAGLVPAAIADGWPGR